MKTRINSNYNKKVLVRGNSLSDVNTLTENEMMLYTKQKDNEPVTKVVPSKIITKINGETKSYKVGGTKIIKNVVTSFRGKDVYPIYIYKANRLLSITKSNDNGDSLPSIYYEGYYQIRIDNLLKKKIKKFYLLLYIPNPTTSYSHLYITCSFDIGDYENSSSTILHYQQGNNNNISYLGHDYALWEINITDKKNIIIKAASKKYITTSDYFTLDGTYYFYSSQKHKYLTLDTRFTGDKIFNSFYLFEGLVDLDRVYRGEWKTPRLYIPIEKIRKNNHCIRSIRCDIAVPPSEDWTKEAATLIKAKLNYRNSSIKGFNGTIKLMVYVNFSSAVPSLDNENIDTLVYYDGIEFRLSFDSDSKNFYLEMERTITVITVITVSTTRR